MTFPKKCEICGLTRLNAGHMPCLDREKLSAEVKEKIKDECPAAPIMYC